MKPTTLAVLFVAGLAYGQAGDAGKPFSYNGNSYVYYSPVCIERDCMPLGVGAGAEGFLWRGLTLGVDLGYHHLTGEGVGFGLLSVNGGYHFADRKKPVKFDPFVTAGYGLAFRQGAVNLVNYGGGVNWWFKPRIGAHVEFRAWTIPQERITATGFRFGVVFR